MILGKNLSASAFFFCLGIYSGSRRKFLPTGRFGTFFCLEVSLGMEVYSSHVSKWRFHDHVLDSCFVSGVSPFWGKPKANNWVRKWVKSFGTFREGHGIYVDENQQREIWSSKNIHLTKEIQTSVDCSCYVWGAVCAGQGTKRFPSVMSWIK